MLAGWLTAVSLVGAVAALSISTFSDQPSVAQASQRRAQSSTERYSQPYSFRQQKVARSIAMFKLGMNPQSANQQVRPEEAEMSNQTHARRTFGTYMEAVSVVLAAIAPPSKNRAVSNPASLKKSTAAETAMHSQLAPAAQCQSRCHASGWGVE